MRSIAIGLTLVCGCATTNAASAIDHGDRAMAAIDITITEATTAHQAGANQVVARCRAEVTTDDSEARQACVTRYGYGPADVQQFETAIDEFRKAYDAIAVALRALEQNWPAVRAAVANAEAVRK